MMSYKHFAVSRRKFIKDLAVLSSFPWIVRPFSKQHSETGHRDTTSHHLLSCNIRVALPGDKDEGVGWSYRRQLAMDVIRAQHPDIVCMQEVLRNQDRDMKDAFPNFFSLGFDGPEMDTQPSTGYHGIAKNIIMFSKGRYELVSAGCYWLSETPHLGGSKSWETARARHVNWVRLREYGAEYDFRVLNTHLDHVKQSAREQQVEMILEETRQYPAGFRQLLAGDFNQDASNRVVQMIKEENWTDSYASVHGDRDPGFTYHGFHGASFPETRQGQIKGKIDFIFGRGDIRFVDAKIIKDNRDGFYPSDHYFISAEILI